jgi:hypothetical protein
MKKLLLLLLILRGGFWAEAQCTSGNCENGFGTAIIKKKGGIRYTGQFINRKPHGRGVAIYPDGSRYEGSWLNGTWDGEGQLTLNDGTFLKGRWSNSRFITLTHESNLVATPVVRPETLTDLDGRMAATTDGSPNPAFEGNRNTPIGTNTVPQVWALAVGVSSYEDPSVLTLKYPTSDAFRMYAFWKSPEGGALDDDHALVMTNDQATKSGVLDTLRGLLTRAGQNDLVTFFYSGHGLKGAFLPTDYDGGSMRVYHSEINELLSACPAKHKLVIADACHSGSYLASKSPRRDKSRRPTQDIQEAFYRELSRTSPGTAFILSSSAEEESLEVSSLHQSIFSYFVLRGLKGEANSNGNEVITVQELFDYVYRNVTAYAFSLGKVQTPVIKGNYDPEMPVAMKKL